MRLLLQAAPHISSRVWTEDEACKDRMVSWAGSHQSTSSTFGGAHSAKCMGGRQRLVPEKVDEEIWSHCRFTIYPSDLRGRRLCHRQHFAQVRLVPGVESVASRSAGMEELRFDDPRCDLHCDRDRTTRNADSKLQHLVDCEVCDLGPICVG